MAVPLDNAPLLVGAPNFRDMGGYSTHDSRTVRFGHLYRSEGLASLTPEDWEVVRGLGIQLICDLRSASERTHIPTLWPEGSAVQMLHLDVSADVRAGNAAMAKALLENPTAEGAREAMLISYRHFPQAFAGHLPTLFGRLLASDGLPLVFHCAAGKDRTGFLAALLLAALGVSQQTILDDYLLSARYWGGARGETSIRQVLTVMFGAAPDDAVIKPLVAVEKAYLVAAFDAIVEQYGSVEGYLETVAGVGPAQREALKSVLLE
jgi:protein-tyrosine phosphatase